MPTLAFIAGFGRPFHLLILLLVFCAVGGLALLIVLVSRRSGVPAGRGQHISPLPPTIAAPPAMQAHLDLDRRRQELELDRMAIENEERRRKLNQ